MNEIQYYNEREELTAGENCDRCIYGACGECHLQCNKSYEDYIREERVLYKILGISK